MSPPWPGYTGRMGDLRMSSKERVALDALGRVNQAAAAACDEVYLVVAGLPLRLK